APAGAGRPITGLGISRTRQSAQRRPRRGHNTRPLRFGRAAEAYWLSPWPAERRQARSSSIRVVADRGAPGRRSGPPAALIGGSGVVAGVVETSWTGSATRDVARHFDTASSADAGLRGRGESAWMGTG